MKLFDTHAHLNFNGFKVDVSEVIKRSFDNGMEGIVNVGSCFDNSQRAVEQAQKYDKIYASVGFHPDHLKEVDIKKVPEMIKKFKNLAQADKVVAIGEIGFDNYYYKTGVNEDIPQNHEKEELIFRSFMDLANELNLPVIIHSRDAEKETINVIRDYSKKLERGGVVHCFTGSIDFAENLLDLNFYIGFTGIITYSKSNNLREVVKRVPIDKILIETDAPYLAPQTYRGQKNEPLYVLEVAKKIAEIKDITAEEVALQTTNNAKKLFLI